MKKTLFLSTLTSPIGILTLGVLEEKLCLLEFENTKRLKKEIREIGVYFDAEVSEEAHPLLEKTKQELGEYFAGKRIYFNIPIVTFGTDLQKKTWEVLQTIPYGKTRSYKQQAEEVGNIKAVRAVASANGRNRIGIIIPCHRVIGSDGSLTGFGGGLEKKKYLLELEASFIR